MNQILSFLLPCIFLFTFSGCSYTDSSLMPGNMISASSKQVKATNNNDNMVEIQIIVGDKSFSAKLRNNKTTRAFIKQMPLTITMDELNGNEKFFYFSKDLPTNPHKPSKIKAGDLMLYGSKCLVLFYKDFSTSYQYTRIGTIDDPASLSDALGPGNADVTFKLQKENIEVKDRMKISVKGNKNTVIFELNDSTASKELYAQLPLTIDIENYSTNEKIFYLPNKLNTADTPLADAEKGTLCYYSPWGNVVMFYSPFGEGSGLYELGQVVSGKDNIQKLSGTVEISIA